VPCMPYAMRRYRATDALDPVAVDSMTDGDVLQATDLRNLSLEERAKAYEDVHGVATVPQHLDDDAHMKEAIGQLELKLRKTRDKQAYDLASFHYPKYTKDPRLLEQFLRAADFDVTIAARRIVLFFEKKLELFGKENLGRRISLQDLDPEVLEAYRLGCYQLFPKQVRDRSGRPVYFHISSTHGKTSKINLLKSFYYTILSGTQEMSPKDHSRGVVLVIHFINVQDSPQEFLRFIMMGMNAAKATPIKVAGLHVCCDNPSLKGAISLVQLSVSTNARVRIRVHFGSYIESLYSLMAFGIDLSIFPMKDETSIEKGTFQTMMELRQQREQEEWKPPEMTPGDNDVLLGRGRPFRLHVGNVQFGNLVDQYRSRFNSANSKQEKAAIVNEILGIVQDQKGGRFLKLTPDGWELATSQEADRKVRHVIRPKAT